MRTIPAREIKRCGISVVDELLKDGPVHVIKNDRPTYVILDELRYEELVEAYEEASATAIRETLEDIEAGRVRRGSMEELLNELGLER